MGRVTSRTFGYGGNIIWTMSWEAALESRDTAITNTAVQRYGYAETDPHNQLGN